MNKTQHGGKTESKCNEVTSSGFVIAFVQVFNYLQDNVGSMELEDFIKFVGKQVTRIAY